ncbi:hypothetical protein BDY19DRAFT_992997 [Irpex rosettiformis]|uniref:Uncharacterized protein n=1 Tax=Irpex rosettiformis TaxID=378272 RepID=A0ACB8U542_9APHY|nr:hypothetical protein BDY19DRAFT_992997 [Irpex rosettiformis]
MPSSLEPLSSPSPSPSPSPPPPDTRASTSNNSGAGAGLDSGSELSELTEDEQENVKSKADREERARPSRRGRKRGGIVPAPMWDWAYKNKKDWKPKMLEEEEEDDQSRPTEVGEEENDGSHRSRSRSGVSSLPERRAKRKSSATVPVDDEDDDEEPAQTSDPGDESASVGTPSIPIPPDDTLNDPDYVCEDDERPPATTTNAHETRGSVTRGVSSEATDEENAEDDDVEPAEVEPPEDEEDLDGNPALDSEDEAEDGGEDTPVPPAPSAIASILIPPTASAAVKATNDPEPTLTPMEVDTAPVPEQVSPIHAAAAASSIMAGSALISPPSPSPSNSSAGSPNHSPASSRSPTPEPLSDREPEPKRGAAKTRGAKAKGGRSARNKPRRKAKVENVVEQDVEQESHLADAEDRDGDLEDIDADSPEIDIELELQPAHRAEALDVLATIELKFALLRESVYVDKMENLAWEEALVTEGIHPEMLHLHAELSKRRDKRLELASRRRDYEVANITKRRKLDEEGVWSWWQLRRDELQTQMISETNRKRRKLDRERRALDRHQPIRRIPSPPRDVPPAPYIRDLFKSSLDAPESKKRHLQESDLVYPQLGALAPNDIAADLDYLFVHRRNMMGLDAARAGFMGFNPMSGGHALPPPQAGFEQFGPGINMGVSDGPGRFPHVSFQQLPPQSGPGQMIQGYPGPGGPSAPRLTHHHSAPAGAFPSVQAQMMLEQEVALGIRSGIPPSAHIVHYPSGVPVNLMRRSISPVLVQPATGGSGGPISGKTSGRSVPGTTLQIMKEHKRVGLSARPSEGEGFEQEKDWELQAERYKAREKEARGREVLNDSHFERERVRERERDRDHDRESEQDLDRPGHIPVPMQRLPSHQHTVGHLHPSSSQAAHPHGPHHHHHHHHHVHHHHHSNSTGPNAVPGGASSTVVALHPSNGILSRHNSPHPNREYERRAHSSAPVEVIDLSSKPAGPGPMSVWKANDDSPSSSLDMHEQGRRNIGLGSQERIPPPAFSLSPRNGPGVPPSHMSVPRPRRESWSAPDEGGQPRPSSSSGPFPSQNATGPSRIPTAGSTTPRPQVSPSIPTRPSPVTVSPSRQNSIRLPPLSPSLATTVRSPLRMPQTLPGPSLPSVTTSSNPSSPKTLRRTSPPLGRPRSPITRDIHSQILSGPPPPIPLSQKSAPTSPGIYPVPLSHPSLPPNPRLPIMGASSET